MNREIEFFREFIEKYVPEGERITDDHTMVEAWTRYQEDEKLKKDEHRKNEGAS